MTQLRNLLLTTLLIALTACGGGGGSTSGAMSSPASASDVTESSSSSMASASSVLPMDEPEFQDLEGDDSEYTFLRGEVYRESLFTSAITGVEYPVHIYLPPGYQESERHYPVIYVLDGQVLFPGIPYLLEDEGVEAIVVAVAEGPTDRRRTDYLLPGARNYFQFLVHELIPFAESGLRVEAGQRTLMGTSFGGVFTGLALLLSDVVDPVFYNFLAFDASFYQHPQETQSLLQNRYLASGEMHANLFLTSALPEGNDEFVNQFEALLTERNFSGLSIHRHRYQTTHGKITEPSFRAAARQLWGNK